VQGQDVQDEQSSEQLYEIEVIDGEVVEHRYGPVEPGAGERLPLWVTTPAVQTAVAAATGFVAGAAMLALLRRYGRARLERAVAGGESLPSHGGVRAYIVHVRPLRHHLD
jgi:hypothetical protein